MLETAMCSIIDWELESLVQNSPRGELLSGES